MHTMVVSMTIDPLRADEVARHLREDIVGWVKRQPGFVSGQWLLSDDRTSGVGAVVFSSKEAAVTAAAGPRGLPRDDGRAWNVAGVTVYEQLASA